MIPLQLKNFLWSDERKARFLSLLEAVFQERFNELPRLLSGGSFLSALYYDHMFFLLQAPLFAAASPYKLFLKKFSVTEQIIIPLFLPLFFLLLALIYDRIVEFRTPPSLDLKDDTWPLTSVALHIPASAAGIFYFLHPFMGLAVTIVAYLFSLRSSFLCNKQLRGISITRSFVYYLLAIFVMLLFLVPFLLIMNLLQTFQILRYIFF